MAPSPIHGRGIAADEFAIVPGVIFHHLHQRLAHLGVMVHDEQLHYCEGAVKGGGKRFSNFVGSARLSWS